MVTFLLTELGGPREFQKLLKPLKFDVGILYGKILEGMMLTFFKNKKVTFSHTILQITWASIISQIPLFSQFHIHCPKNVKYLCMIFKELGLESNHTKPLKD